MTTNRLEVTIMKLRLISKNSHNKIEIFSCLLIISAYKFNYPNTQYYSTNSLKNIIQLIKFLFCY